MKCQRCSSERILDMSGKCSDCFGFSLGGKEKDSCYVPSDMNVGGGDYISLCVCLDCGQIQGEWPVPKTEFEKEIEEQQNDPFKEGDFVEYDHDGQLIVGRVLRYSRDDAEVSIEVHGTWDKRKDQLGPMPIVQGRPNRTIYADADEVKKSTKDW